MGAGPLLIAGKLPRVTENNVAELRARAEQAFVRGAFEEALADYVGVLASQPAHFDARLRTADCLLALGQVQRAAVVYTTLARHAAGSGHPLRALVAIKILSTLEPLLLSLVTSVAELYAADGRVGRGVRPVPPDEGGPVASNLERLRTLRGEALWAEAERYGKAAPSLPELRGLPAIPLLSELSREDFCTVFSLMQLVRRRRGESVIRQGDSGQSFFLAARGDFDVIREEPDGSQVHLTTLHEGSVFGEMALLIQAPRSAHIVTTSEADLLELHVEALGQLSGGAATVARALAKFTRERLVNNLINTSQLFRPLSLSQRIDLVRRFVAHEVAPQTDLIREGESGRGLYVVLQGAVDVWKRVGDEKVLLATLKAGEVFGEMSLLDGVPAGATVTAAERSTVLFLARDYVERLMESVPELATYLSSLGEERGLDTRMWLDTTGAVSARDDLSLEIDVDWGD